MSIKDLFGSSGKQRNFLDSQTEKDAFSEIESARNLKQLNLRQKTFLPNVDYSDPASFAKFGSAYLYYQSAIKRILEYYPYDGSDAELNKFYNSSLDIEKYIFNNLYPRTNGYINLSAGGYGSVSSVLVGNSQTGIASYGAPTTPEYITFNGGPNIKTTSTTLKSMYATPSSSQFQSNNVYNTDIYTAEGLISDYGVGTRESNLKSNLSTGVTVEFWSKTGSVGSDPTQTTKQVLFDMWNSELSSSEAYARLTIELTGGAGAGNPLLITVQSGNVSASAYRVVTSSIGQNLDFGDWNHYALVFQSGSGYDFVAKLYVNGELNDTNTYTGTDFIGELNSKNMRGRIGGLLTAPSGACDISLTSSYVGAGKLSGSLDEFRFWKAARDGSQIGRYWFDQVRGGANSDISNADLGMYYKFNEGILGSSGADSTVLDYGGRLCNGTWTGYAPGSGSETSRNTGSAIVSASAAEKEYLDPIVYPAHPDVSSLKTSLLDSGSYHDGQNSAMFKNLLPAWVLEEDDDLENTDLEQMCHIIGTYFDKLHLQITAVPEFKHHNYPSASEDPLPFAQHLPQSLGLETPDIFIDASILERFKNRNDTELFESTLHDTKNLIYTNLYNNLANIFKAKGTERAIRNTLRCFNLDDNLVLYNVYSNNQMFELKDNLKQTLKKKTFVNFNNEYNTQAVIYQSTDPHTTPSRGYISGSTQAEKNGFTTEVTAEFPRFFRHLDPFTRDFVTCSIFGMQTVNSASYDDPAFLTASNEVANFQVYAIRDQPYSKNVRFMLTSSLVPYPLPTLTSSNTFLNVYDNENWNFSVRIKPSNYPFADVISSSAGYTYDVIFSGHNNKLGTIANSFTATGSIPKSVGQLMLSASKRIYAGARNTNITGASIYKSDILLSNVKYWTTYLDDLSLKQHTFDRDNAGISGSYRSLSPLTSSESYNYNTLALDWYFANVTASNASGDFYADDISSGSALIRDSFGWVGQLAGHLHTGRGAGFGTSSANVVKKETVNDFKFVEPERSIGSDQVQILSADDQLFGTVEQIPNYVYTIEKSLYANLTDEILDFFAGAVDFHHLIGQPVNRYRSRYKEIEGLRRVFFEKFQSIQTVEKFTEYYKWFDDALAMIIQQMVPASSNFVPDVYNTIESHVLERNKYNSQYPTIEFVGDIRPGIIGSSIKIGDYVSAETGGPTSSPRNVNKHIDYWKKKADPRGAGTGSFEISSGDIVVDANRKSLRDAMWRSRASSGSALARTQPDGTIYYPDTGILNRLKGVSKFHQPTLQRTIKGGVNFESAKDIGYTYASLYAAGPVNHDGGIFVPQNVIVGFTDEMEELQALTLREELHGPNQLTKRYMSVYLGRDFTDGIGYDVIKNSTVFPFNIISSSVSGGYNQRVLSRVTGGIEVTNVHNDVYGPDMEVPMQGPFTNALVGGHQSRHVPLNTGTDDYLTRPEAWKLLLGRCTGKAGTPGAIGMVSPDYPYPEANAEDMNPYPMTGAQKATYYRDMTAKRPVNITNIPIETGSTRLGNYSQNYEVVHTVGAYSNPKKFVENNSLLQLPTQVFQNTATSSTQTRTFLDIHREDDGHFKFVDEFSINYLTASTKVSSVIISKFSNPGGLEVSPPGYRDFRSDEYSVYNATPYRNLTVIKPSQGPSGSLSEATGAGGPGTRVFDIHGYDYGLRSHLARHTAQFGRDSFWVTGTTSVFQALDPRSGGPGAHYSQLPGFHKINRNRLRRPRLCGATSCDSAEYDNFFVQHQIPRSDRQYAWITGAISESSDYRYYGFMPTFGPMMGRYSSSVGGIEAFFPFVSASDFGSHIISGQRGWGQSRQGTIDLGFGSSYVPTPFNHLNVHIYEPITTAGPSGSNLSFVNTLGYPSGTSLTDGHLTTNTQYRNFTFVPAVGPGPTTPSLDTLRSAMFNALMLKRNSIYGWGTFNQNRQSNHPVLRAERRDNKLSLIKSGSSIERFDLKPLSLKGRPVLLNYDYDTYKTVRGITTRNTQNVTLKTSYNNELIYFNQQELNNHLGIDPHTDNEVTTFEQLVALRAGRDYNLNWISYKECVYPSMRNEFSAHSSFRAGYDNKFWRTSLADRIAVGQRLSNSLGIYGQYGASAPAASDVAGLWISSSCWPLDAPQDFLTRAGPPVLKILGSSVFETSLRKSSSGGELQNTYGWWHASASNPNINSDLIMTSLSPAALYARKHTLNSPLSITSPGQITTKYQLGSYPAGFEFLPDTLAGGQGATKATTGSGEAYWDAPTTAGYLTESISTAGSTSGSTIVGFVSAASEPWFNDYDAFKADLKLKARGYSVIPEFRISEKVESYLRSAGQDFNMLQIPGTGLDSTEDSFYLDYSNSDFMKNFLDIRNLSDLSATEFRLTCRAAIRFNPYRGFYPAQRTLDLVSQFSRSYGNAISIDVPSGSSPGTALSGAQASTARIIYQPLFAPGILYNSIKSGIACDWPVISNQSSSILGRYNYTGSATPGVNIVNDGENYAWYPQFYSAYDPFQGDDREELAPYKTGSVWTKRLPFETIIAPEKHMLGLQLTDMEPHPNVAFSQSDASPVASLVSTPADSAYSLMASNFTAEVANFFLKNNAYTKLSSEATALDKIRFSGRTNEVYGCRIRIKNSFDGDRTYQYESGAAGDNTGYSLYGAAAYNTASMGSDAFTTGSIQTTGSFEIPQDPQYNPHFKRNFVMYSRTTAFGPPFSGRIPGEWLTAAPGAGTNFQPDTYVSGANSSTYGVRDSLNGYNWAFTPPHQHGESWADLIFRPSGNVDYDLERILQETQVVRWRHDPGPRIGLQRPSEGKWQHSLVSDSPPLASGDPPLLPNYGIYNSHNTNHNAMQLDDSVNLFGVENIYRQRTDKFGKVISNENEVVGKRWVIQPKFETPMLNFADVGLHPITGSGNTKTLPANFGDDAAANGMWHQFGIMPEDNSKGIFLEIDDIPAAWLQHHYSVVSESSTYNNSSPDPSLYKNMKSFSSLLGFGQDNSKVRLGDIAPKQTIKEAVVAVPYVIENSLVDPKTTASDKNYELKKFINIPKTRYDAALSEAEGSAMGDSLDAAGASIRQLVDKMGQYVLPEQLDFVQNPLIEPIVMYIFEFKYDLDQNDLSYIWQNLAPRQYKKMFFQTEAVAHELFNTELLTEQNIMENPNLRWMVFKVKQKSQASYEDIIVRQASSATSGIKIDNRQIPPARPTTGYPIRYNWPYDYVSIVELAKIEAEVLYKKKTTSLMNTQNQEVNTASGKLSTINTALRRSTRALTPAVAPTVATETAKVEEKKIQSMIKEKTVEESAATAVKQSQAREASYNANLEKQKSARSTKMKGLRQTLDSFKQTSKPATKSKNRSKSPPPNTRKKKY